MPPIRGPPRKTGVEIQDGFAGRYLKGWGFINSYIKGECTKKNSFSRKTAHLHFGQFNNRNARLPRWQSTLRFQFAQQATLLADVSSVSLWPQSKVKAGTVSCSFSGLEVPSSSLKTVKSPWRCAALDEGQHKGWGRQRFGIQIYGRMGSKKHIRKTRILWSMWPLESGLRSLCLYFLQNSFKTSECGLESCIQS